ncbi:Predicted arabinose efflux permease, MFS family [Lentzea albida]|uniref:Predicted arabinose efflux permease, MFS family n=2 Tax=Lentzea albida TaxID=65499 RepID=A0A1H9ETD5_9PSEU|nr:Predicted arabinose efflux permease, MFS family [Lentzea albida]
MLTLVGLTVRLHDVGPGAVATLFAAGTVGGVLGTPVGGRLVDRYRNRSLFVLVLIAQAVTLSALIAVASVPAAVIAGLAIMGMLGAMATTCTSVLVARLTAEDDGVRGFSWLSTARTAGAMAGTLLGGVVAAGPGLEIALAIDAGASVVQAFLISRIRTDRDPRVHDRSAGTSRRSLAGLAQLGQDGLLTVRLAAHVVTMTAMTIALANEIFLVTGVMRQNEVVYGVVVTCWGVGVMAGAVVTRRLKGVDALLRAYLVGTGVMAAAFAVTALFPHPVVNAVAWIAGGGCAAVQNVTLMALVQNRTPEACKGRVHSAAGTCLIIANTAGYLSAGPVISSAGPRNTLFIAAALIVPATLAMVVVVLRERAGSEPAAPGNTSSPPISARCSARPRRPAR